MKWLLIYSQIFWIFLLFFPPVSNLTYPDDDSDGIDSFQQFYRCYFNKYFKQEDGTGDLGREAFVAELLQQTVMYSARAPSTACVQWMCDHNLVWKIWNVGSVEVWAYFTDNGNSVQAWQDCLEDREEEFETYKTIQSGRIYKVEVWFLIF